MSTLTDVIQNPLLAAVDLTILREQRTKLLHERTVLYHLLLASEYYLPVDAASLRTRIRAALENIDLSTSRL